MRVLVCGSRSYKGYELVKQSLSYYKPGTTTVVEGCASGADRLAEIAAYELGMRIEHHPADWKKYGRRAGYIRNVEMLDSGIDVVLAFWDGESKGTAHTMREAEARGITVYDVLRDIAGEIGG